jgi:hypothetical protein
VSAEDVDRFHALLLRQPDFTIALPFLVSASGRRI